MYSSISDYQRAQTGIGVHHHDNSATQRASTNRARDSLNQYYSQSSSDPTYATIRPRSKATGASKSKQSLHEDSVGHQNYANIDGLPKYGSFCSVSTQGTGLEVSQIMGQSVKGQGEVGHSCMNMSYPQQVNYRSYNQISSGVGQAKRSNSVSGGNYGTCSYGNRHSGYRMSYNQSSGHLQSERISYSQGASPQMGRMSYASVGRNSYSLPLGSAPSRCDSRASVHTYRTSGMSTPGHRLSGISDSHALCSLPAGGVNKTSNSLSVTEGFKFGMKELARVLYMPFACCKKKEKEPVRIEHLFRHYYFYKPRTCFACKQKVWSHGSACQICRYICHRQCENQVMTSCVPQANHELRHDSVNRYQFSPREPPVSGSSTPGAKMSTMRDMLNRSQEQNEEDQLVLDLVYITERIISMSFPSDGHEATYRYNLKEVMTMLRTKHGDNCLVLNLSETRQDLEKLSPKHVMDYGWPDFLAPPLERLCNICKTMDSWLNSDPNHVVVVHCKGSNSRIALIIAAFMHYSSICASADQALDRFAMKRFYDDKLGGITHPSQQRYVEYFHGLLSGSIKINSNPLYLHHIVIHGVPNFDTKGGCRPFIQVYQGMQPIFTSGVYNVTDQMQKVCISISPGIPLRGDIMIKCYHKKTKAASQESVWSCQFHTCAIAGFSLVFAKKDLDDARIDPRFPDSGKVEFVFGSSQDSQVKVSDFKSDVTVPVDDNDNIDQWDSFKNYANSTSTGSRTIDDMNINGIPTGAGRTPHVISNSSMTTSHASGPVDGSLYATVTKRKHEQTGQTIIQNGVTTMTSSSHDHVTGQQNGSHTSSVDSGISASSGIVGNQNTSMSSSMNITPQYSTGVHNEPAQRNYSSTVNSSKSSYSTSSTAPKKSVPPLDEQTQLDMILSDLLNDQVFVSSPTSPKSSSTTSKDTRTFRTYDTQVSPDGKATYQTAEVTYKMPGGYKEERNYSMTKTEEKQSYAPTNAFSYTATSPELARKVDSPKTHTLPYKTDYDNRYYSENSQNYRTMDSSGSMSPHDHTNSWLQEQQQKLRQRKDSKDEKTVQQERQLVEELKTAQNKYLTKRAVNQADEQATMETYRTTSPPVANGPVSGGNYSYTVTRSHTYNTEKSPQDQINTSWSQGYNTGDSLASYSSTRSENKAKPPPSPGQIRANPPVAPAPIPVRTSSKDYMQRSRTTSSSSWQGKANREQEVLPPVIRSISITTPPQSPRAFSPVNVQLVQQYHAPPPPPPAPVKAPSPQPTVYGVTSVTPTVSNKTIHTTIRTSNDNLETHLSPAKTKVTEVQEVSHPDGEKKSHYITEVFVHRTPGSSTTTLERERKERAERETNRLEELEKSLQAASNSIMSSQPWQQTNTTGSNKSYSTTEHHVTRKVETRKFETQQQHQEQQQRTLQKMETVSSMEDQPRRSMSPVWDNLQHDQVVTFESGCRIAIESPEVSTEESLKSSPSSDIIVGFVEANTAFNKIALELSSDLERRSSHGSLKLDGDSRSGSRRPSGASVASGRLSVDSQGRKLSGGSQELLGVENITGGRLSVDSQGRKLSGGSQELLGVENITGGRLSVDSQGRKLSGGSQELLGVENITGGRLSVDYQGRKLSGGSQELLGVENITGGRLSVDSQGRKLSGGSQELLVSDTLSQERKLSNYENMPKMHVSPSSGFVPEGVVGHNVHEDEMEESFLQPQEPRFTDGGFQIARFTDDYRKSFGFIADENFSEQKSTEMYSSKVKGQNSEIDIEKQGEVGGHYCDIFVADGAKDVGSVDVCKEVITVERPKLILNKSVTGKEVATSGVKNDSKLEVMQGHSESQLNQIERNESQIEMRSNVITKQRTDIQGQRSESNVSGFSGMEGRGIERNESQIEMRSNVITKQKTDAKGQRSESNIRSFSGMEGRDVERNESQIEIRSDVMKGVTRERKEVQGQSLESKLSITNTSGFVSKATDRNESQIEMTTNVIKGVSKERVVQGERSELSGIDTVSKQSQIVESGSDAKVVTGISESRSVGHTRVDISTSSSQSSVLMNQSAGHSEFTQVTNVQESQVQSPPPPPKQISVIEEDRISLRPIGPGMQPLEPEGGTNTLGRATTPSFPISPVASAEDYIRSVHDKVRRMSLGSRSDLPGRWGENHLTHRRPFYSTPPFPVSPRTPYYHQASTPGLLPGSASFDRDEAYNAMVSRQMCRNSDPMYASIPEDIGAHKAGNQVGTMSQQQQFQYQTQQHHQEYHTQQQSSSQQPNITPHGTTRAITPQEFSHQQHFGGSISPQNGTHGFHESQNYHTQQHHTQQHHTQRSDGSQALHIDTSPRMLSHSGSTSRTPTSPPSPSSLNTLRHQLSVGGTMSPTSHSVTGQSSPSLYFGTSRRGSISSLADSEPAHITTPRFVRDTSKFWYKPHISREDAIVLLKDKQPGSFVVRDSNSYPGAFGLALKVAQIPPNVQTKSTGDPAADLVRHFLVEPTHKGVRLRGSNNEPIFGSLASLVYQHSITPLSLPCKLMLPDAEAMATMDTSSTLEHSKSEMPSSAAALLAQGAACNVLFLCSIDTESLTGPQAVTRAVKMLFDTQPLPKTTVVHFKVSNQGITLTDNQRKLFFRRHYPVAAVTYCGMDPENRKFKRDTDVPNVQADARVFGFVARKSGGASDNACHLFAELDPEQPASAIVNFVTKIMIGHGKVKS